MPAVAPTLPSATRLFAFEPGDGVGRLVIEVDSADSTNRQLIELGRAGAPHGTVLIARDQTAGRGKGERVWFSTRDGSLCLSVLVRTRRPLTEAAQLPLLAAVAMREAVLAATGVEAGIKWPNDLLVGGRKICGILAEVAYDDRGVFDFVVVGMGLNLAIPDAAFPEDLRAKAASLATLAGRPVGRDAFVGTFGAIFDRWVNLWEQHGLAAFAETWSAHALHLGQVVRLVDDDEDLCATLVGLAADGALRVRDAAGAMRDVHSSDITTDTSVDRNPLQLSKTHTGAFP